MTLTIKVTKTVMSTVVKMTAVLGGTSRAPLMAIFLVVEMSGHYSLLMPVACAAATSYLIVSLLKKSASHPPRTAK